MERECFRECISLTEIDIPHGVKVIPENAFCDSGLEKVTYGDIEVFDEYAFSGTMLKEFRILASTTRVDYGAFAIDIRVGVIRGYVEMLVLIPYQHLPVFF